VSRDRICRLLGLLVVFSWFAAQANTQEANPPAAGLFETGHPRLNGTRVSYDGSRDPRFTIDVIEGTMRRWYQKERPFRFQVGDADIATCRLVGHAGDVIVLRGRKAGKTTVTLWFGDINNLVDLRVTQYEVNVLRLMPEWQAVEEPSDSSRLWGIHPPAGVCIPR
jgi:hypothetical protein